MKNRWPQPRSLGISDSDKSIRAVTPVCYSKESSACDLLKVGWLFLTFKPYDKSILSNEMLK